VPVLDYIIVAVAAYLLGSIPTGFLVAKAKGIDIRNVGSGNIGATNAMRVLGKPAGIFVLLMDAAKGFAAVAWLTPFVLNEYARWLIHENYKVFADGTFIMEHPTILTLGFQNQSNEVQFQFFLIAGIFAVLGHNYTCWLKFKGGKGIATTAGVFLALAPWALLVALVVFILAVALTKYVSVGSITAAIALPVTVWIMSPYNLFLCIVTTALGVLAIWKHKSNIQRLVAGTENRLGKKSSTPENTK
jgi:acyl phosphate:glycerol-3-phosphate acyltransferase